MQKPSVTVCTCGYFSKKKCREIFESILLKEFSDFRNAQVHRLTVDAYSLQHPDVYMISPKSFTAHLTGMCCAMEFGNDAGLLKILQKWLNGKKHMEKPDMLENFGHLTIAHVQRAESSSEYAELIWEWARDVWEAYGAHHALAKHWVETARREFSGK